MLYVLVEGHGEKKAVGTLISRLMRDLQIHDLHVKDVIRFHRITSLQGIADGCELIRARGDATALLILKDDEDKCPVETVPSTMPRIASLGLPFPVAFCVLYREYEVIFLASLPSLAGQLLIDERGIKRPGITSDAQYTKPLEAYRDVKGIISGLLGANRTYKPTVDQLPLTRLVDFGLVRASGLPAFGTLERCLKFLASNRNCRGSVYPNTLTINSIA